MNTYELCLKMIDNPRYTKEELQVKFDMLYLMGRLEDVQYQDLTNKVKPVEEVIEETQIVE